jgi:mannose-6-phosphate isomerase-like protein (cupin superfamily)
MPIAWAILDALRSRIVSAKDVDFKDLVSLAADRVRRGDAYLEFLRVAAMSAGLYVLPAGGVDAQTPHGQDELYYVVRGKARMRAGAEDRPLEAGTVVFVAAHVEHRFYDIQEELMVLVLFAPAES